MAALVGRAPGAGDPWPCVEAFHHGRTQTDVEWLAHQRGGNRVGVACDLHVIIHVDPRALPLRLRRGRRRQGPACRAVEGVKPLLACARPLLARAGMQRRQAGREGRMARRACEEGVGAQAGQHPAFDDLPTSGPRGFLPGLGRAGGDDGAAIVRGEVRVGPMEGGCRAVGPEDGRCEGIGDADLGDPAERRQGPDVCADPVGQTLGPRSFGLGGTGGSQDRHQDGGLVDRPAVMVDNGESLPSVIH